MKRLLAAIPLVFPVFVAAQDSVGSVKDAPPRITPEMKAKTETIARALEGLTPEGFTKKRPVERYTEANLYEKINGRSELFHSYDVTGMTFFTFSRADDPGKLGGRAAWHFGPGDLRDLGNIECHARHQRTRLKRAI
jgi:hypothetical protein